MKKRVISILLAALMALSLFGTVSFAADNNAVVVSDEEGLLNAIEAIPEGGKGEITIENVNIGLSQGFYFENKDITFNLYDAYLSTAVDEYGYCGPVFFGYGSNITINMYGYSCLETQGHTGCMGVVRVDNSTDWNEETQSFKKDFNLIINGGTIVSLGQPIYDEESGEHIEDVAVVAAPGVNVELTDVTCHSKVEAIDFAGVGINVPGKLIINSGKFVNNVKAYVPEGKYCGEAKNYYYVRESEMTDEFASLLTNGKLVVDYVKPESTDSDALWLLSEDMYYSNPDIYIEPESFNEDLTKCELGYCVGSGKEEYHTVEVVWNYESDVLKVAESFVKKFPEDREMFEVTDLEFINYLAYHDMESTYDSLANYSGELKSYLNNTNFTFPVEDRAGSDGDLITEVLGSANLMHNGIVYFAHGRLGARAEHIIYVPEATADTPEALMAAAQKRVDEYLGKGVAELSLIEITIDEYCEVMENQYREDIRYNRELLEAEMAKPEDEQDIFVIWDCQSNIDNATRYLESFLASIAEGGELEFLEEAAGDSFFLVETKNDAEAFVIIKDDDKITTPAYRSVDLATKVEVNTKASGMPLDTIVKVDELTAGEEYDKIIKLLDVEENSTYDINLYSESLDENITKLESGTFEVKIPVTEELKGKSLVVYYVDDNGKIIEYEVEEKDGYAVFVTNHFSIYTLAELKEENPPTSDMNITFLAAVMLVTVVGALGLKKIKSL